MFEIDGMNKEKVYLYSNVLIVFWGFFVWLVCWDFFFLFFGSFKLSGFYTVTMVLNQNQTQILLSFLFVTA